MLLAGSARCCALPPRGVAMPASLRIFASRVIHFLARHHAVAEFYRREEALELLVIPLRPLVKGMLVALGALDAHTEKGMGKTLRLGLGLGDVPARPELREVRPVRKVRRVVLTVIRTHLLGKLKVALVFTRAAGGHHHALDDFVVRLIGFQPVKNPVVPLARHLVGVLPVEQVAGVVAGVIAQLRGPPRGVAGTLQKLIDFLRALVWIFISEKGAHLAGQRQRAGDVQTRAPQENFVGANPRGHHAELAQLVDDQLVEFGFGRHGGIIAAGLIGPRQNHRHRRHAVVVKRDDVRVALGLAHHEAALVHLGHPLVIRAEPSEAGHVLHRAIVPMRQHAQLNALARLFENQFLR